MKRMMGIWVVIMALLICGCSSDSIGPVDEVPNTESPEPVELHHDDVFGHFGYGDEEGNDSRSLIVIISDVHLGDQRSIDQGYGWCINNRDKLTHLLNNLANRPAVKELVIAGDLFDEWVIPMREVTLNGYGHDEEAQSKFLDTIAEANIDVVNGIRNLLSSGVKVTYVPGNHDMLVSDADMKRLFPGINQARDAAGLGAYSPENLSSLVIEHGHRYDFYNAPDMLSNRPPASAESYTENPDATLPPGFFVSKIAASYGYSGTVHEIMKESGMESTLRDTQDGLFLYWASWKVILAKINVTDDRYARIIKSGIDGYTADFAINDLAPPGYHEPLLYKKIEDNWAKRQSENLVNVPIGVGSAIVTGAWSTWCDYHSNTQYFNFDPTKRIVVFGHTHHATFGYRKNMHKKQCIYANSGTWVDKGDPSRTFVIIEPLEQMDKSVKVDVNLYQYNNDEKVIKLNGGSIVL